MASLLRKLPIKHFSNVALRLKHKQKHKRQHFVILRATPEDFEDILVVMRRAYYPDEPTCRSLAFIPNNVMEEQTLKSLSEGYSLVAKCKYNGDVLGACINGTTTPWDPDMKDKLACIVDCVKTRQLLHFYAHMQRVPDLWNKYEVPKVFELEYLFVRKTDRRKGIALKLMEASRNLAADAGFTLVRVDATSENTAKLCEKMKLQKVAEIPYCTYLGVDQRPIFNPPDPHKSVKVYVDDEPQKNTMKTK